MKPQTVYVFAMEGEETGFVYKDVMSIRIAVKPLTALVFTVEEFEAEVKKRVDEEKLKIASEAWDAAETHAIEVEKKDWCDKIKAPSKEAYLSTIKK